jgi:multiple sugar transport system substrate-binding protein
VKRLLAILSAVIFVLSACVAPTPQVVEKVTKETVVVEKQSTVVVEATKLVEKETVVEKVITATPAPAKTGPKDVIVLKSGTGVVTDHPFFAMVDEYNRTHPNVEVKLDIAPWSGDIWAALGTSLAAGNPPDIMRVSIGGLVGQGALQSPLLIDVKPYLTPEEIADYGPDIIAPTDIGGKYVIWPQDRDWGTSLVANGTMLKDAGIDVEKIKKDGWTFDEFREAAKKLTKDTNGDGKPETYGFGFSKDYLPSIFYELAHRAGIPDGSANMGAYFWGNKFSLTGPNAVQAVQLVHDMIYTDKSAPKEVTGLTEHMPLLWSGKVAMIDYWHGAVGEIKAYNNSIDKGEVQGEKANFNVVLLPWPYDPQDGANVNIARTTGLALFKQQPYKGDEHTANVAEFVRYLTSPVNLATFANWEGTIPAKTSAFPYSTQIKEPEIQWWSEFARAHAVDTFPYGHPALGQVDSDAIAPGLIEVMNDQKTAEQAVADWTVKADKILADWVAQNPKLAEEWAKAPAGWPDSYMKPLAGSK